MPDFAVKTIFNAAGNTVSQLQKMTLGATLFGDKASKAFQKASSQGNIFKSVMGGLAGYLSARMILKFADDSIKAFNESQEASSAVAIQIKNSNAVAGKSFDYLSKQAELFQKNTFFEDDTIMKDVTSNMLTFTSVVGTQFDRAQAVVLDMTASMKKLKATGADLETNTKITGKVLSNYKYLGSLSKQGIVFSKQQMKMAESLFKSGKMGEYQNYVLDLMEKRYKGSADELAKTNGGIELQSKNMIGSLQEVVGEGLAPIKLGLLTLARDAIGFAIPYLQKISVIVDKLTPPVQELFGSVMELGSALWDMVATILSPFIGKLTILEDVLNFVGGVIKFVAGVVKNFAAGLKIVWPILAILAGIIGTVTFATWLFNTALVAIAANPIGAIITGIVLLITAIGWISTHWKEFSKFFTDTWNNIAKFFIDTWNNFTKWITSGIQWLVNSFIGLVDGIGKFIMKNKDALSLLGGPFTIILNVVYEIIQSIQRAWDGITQAFAGGDIIGGILRIGGALISGILYPIQKILEFASMLPGVGDLAKGAAESLSNVRAGLEGGYFENNAPNKQEAQSRASGYRGDLFIHSQQPTNYVEKKSGAQPINVSMLGLNY